MLKIETIQAEDLVARHMRPGLPLLSILHGIQAEAGYVPPAVIGSLAQALNLSRAAKIRQKPTPPAPMTPSSASFARPTSARARFSRFRAERIRATSEPTRSS